MYKHNARQINFVDDQPELFGNLPLNPENRWVKLARLIPWSRVEEEYRKNLKAPVVRIPSLHAWPWAS